MVKKDSKTLKSFGSNIKYELDDYLVIDKTTTTLKSLNENDSETYMLEAEDGTLQAETSTVIIKPKQNTSYKSILKLIETVYPVIEVDSLGSNGDIYFVRFNTENCIEISNAIWKTGLVVFSSPSFLMLEKTHNHLFYTQWALQNNGWTYSPSVPGIDIRAVEAWGISRGNNIKVAVIDDGVQLDHPDLQANIYMPANFAGGVSSGDGNPSAGNTHGTACAGIIAAVDNSIGMIGVAPDCKIIPIRDAYETSENSVRVTTSEIKVRALNYAWNTAKADVISCSWGGGSVDSAHGNELAKASTQGRGGKGCIIFFASGNDDEASIINPSTNANVLSIGAIGKCGQRVGTDACDYVGWGSNYGTGLALVAPGIDNITTNINSNYWSFGGTSAATPHVAGVAALVLSINPNLTKSEVVRILIDNARKLEGYTFNASGWNNEVGYGLVDAYASCLAATKLSISGNDYVCGEGLYSISNPLNLPVTSVSFSIINYSGMRPAMSQQSSISTRISSYEGQASQSFTLVARPRLSSGVYLEFTKQVYIESKLRYSGTWSQQTCLFYNVQHPAVSGTLSSTQSSYFLHQGCLATINFTNIEVGQPMRLSTYGAIPDYWNYNANTRTLLLRLPYGSGGIPYTFVSGPEGGCGERSITFFSVSNNGNLKNAIVEKKEVGIKEVKVYNLSGVLVYSNKQEMEKFNIYNTNLSNGVYIVVMNNGSEILTDKVLLKR
ncbi:MULTISPECIES: S8 family peptidase [unclassified Dysgonomonas]|uniref:S8 family peptidase n=1 Tax=unclassified Dysgonomonas TaxID=2630389 RepID=UPI002474D6A6|nr:MULTISPECIES: S8 family peptidase [unclassified Dysgonomonas]